MSIFLLKQGPSRTNQGLLFFIFVDFFSLFFSIFVVFWHENFFIEMYFAQKKGKQTFWGKQIFGFKSCSTFYYLSFFFFFSYFPTIPTIWVIMDSVNLVFHSQNWSFFPSTKPTLARGRFSLLECKIILLNIDTFV